MRNFLVATFAAIVIGAPLAIADERDAPDTVVVCHEEYILAMQPWIAHREAQGHRVTVVSSAQPRKAIRETIRSVNRAGGVRNIVLIGDADDVSPADSVRKLLIPAHPTPAKVNVRFGSEPEIATDNWYADFDDDELPDAAIGRLPVDSAVELRETIEKILAYENSTDHGAWRRQVNFVAGVGGFGSIADSVLEFATKRFLTDGVPASYSTTMTYGSWRSPYCPDPRRFHETTLQRLNEGCLFWVYIGHGQRREVDRVHTPWRDHHILEAADMGKVGARQGAPIAIFLACYAGAYDGPEDCLAEELLKTPRGPVAVIAGSRVTMPYSMAVLAHAMLDEYFQQRRLTIGEVVLNAKRRLAGFEAGGAEDAGEADKTLVAANSAGATAAMSYEEMRKLIDAVGAVVSPSGDELPAERQEHLSLFNLLGDPLMRLPQPIPIDVTVNESVIAGDFVEAKGTAPIAGRYTVELICKRGLFKQSLDSRESFDPAPESLAGFQSVYDKANDQVWASRSFDSPGGEFRIRIPTPREAAGSCHVRVFAEGATGFALGSADVYVEPEAARSVKRATNGGDAGADTAARPKPENPIRRAKPR